MGIQAYEVTFDVRKSDTQEVVSEDNTMTVFASNGGAALRAVEKMAESIAPGFDYVPTQTRKLTGDEILSLL